MGDESVKELAKENELAKRRELSIQERINRLLNE